MSYKSVGVVGTLTALVALLYTPVSQRLLVFGVTRPQASFRDIHGLETLRKIPNTAVCEDLHHHIPSNEIFTACQDDAYPHTKWFPAMAKMDDHKAVNTGSLTVIDPTAFTSRKLKLNGFSGPFITHGIDVIASSNDPSLLYIFAINHLPNPEHYGPVTTGTPASPDKARSQIEVFTHKVGSTHAEHVRSIRHPLIRTPNDIYATSETSFYVTNDHFYREGPLRTIEDLLEQNLAPWTDTVHVTFDAARASDAASNVIAKVALSGMHNNNGLGHSSPRRPNDVLIGDASGGLLSRTTRDSDDTIEPKLSVQERLQFDSTIDNPTWYEDKWATPGNNASGLVLAGCGRALDLAESWAHLERPVPTMIWLAQPATGGKSVSANDEDSPLSQWAKRLIFQDGGKNLRSAATAVIVGIDPASNGGKKQGWLFASGFISESVVAAKIDL